MKRLGSALMALGLVIELALVVSLNLKSGIVPLLLAVGLGNSALLALLGVGLLGGGAVVRRIGVRQAERERALLAQPGEGPPV